MWCIGFTLFGLDIFKMPGSVTGLTEVGTALHIGASLKLDWNANTEYHQLYINLIRNMKLLIQAILISII